MHASGCIDVVLGASEFSGDRRGCTERTLHTPYSWSRRAGPQKVLLLLLLLACSGWLVGWPAPCAVVTAAGAAQSGRDSQRVRRCPITSTSLYELLIPLYQSPSVLHLILNQKRKHITNNTCHRRRYKRRALSAIKSF